MLAAFFRKNREVAVAGAIRRLGAPVLLALCFLSCCPPPAAMAAETVSIRHAVLLRWPAPEEAAQAARPADLLAAEAFLDTLNALSAGASPEILIGILPAPDAGGAARTRAAQERQGQEATRVIWKLEILPSPDKAAHSAAELLALARSGGEPDLILLSGAEALAALAAPTPRGEQAPMGCPIVCLGPDCLPEAVPADFVGKILLTGPEFWQERLLRFARAASFKRLGCILPPSQAPLGQQLTGRTVLKAGQELADGGAFQFFSYEELAATGPEQCREAVDYLFFDEIDAMILDGNACLRPGPGLSRENTEELAALLRQRGILPISLADLELSRKSAILGVADEDVRRRGRILALEAFSAYFADNASEKTGAVPAARAEHDQPLATVRTCGFDGQVAFGLDLKLARSMGFDPPVWLLALSSGLER